MMNSGLPIFLGLHILSMLAFSFGILFLVFWAFKSLSGADLWKWGWILLTGAVILCLLSIIAAPMHGYGMRGGFEGMKMKWTSGCSGDSRSMPMMEGSEVPAAPDGMMKMMKK